MVSEVEKMSSRKELQNFHTCGKGNSKIGIKKYFHCKSEQTLKSAARRACGIFVLQDIENLAGQARTNLISIVEDTLFWAGGWTKWVAEVPFKLNSYIIQGLYELILYMLWIKHWEVIWLLIKYLHRQKILYTKCIFNLTSKDKRRLMA